MKVNMKKLAVAVIIVAIGTLVGATMAQAGGYTNITGEYAFTGIEFCFPSTGGLGSNSSQGVFIFHNNGTYSLESTGAVLNYVSNAQYSAQVQTSSTGTYTLSSDGAMTFITDPPGIIVTYLTGPAAEMTFKLYPKTFTGYISVNKMTITFGNVEPETETVYNSDGTVRSTQVCTSSRVAVRIR
ncbi:MAG: hypothetical protein ACXU9G_08315 [Syntrophales bacterium]